MNHQEPPERAHRRKRATAAPTPDGVGQQVWADWLVVRKGKRVGSVTPTVLHGIRREAAKAGLSLEDALRVSVEAGWAGFRADWYANRAGSSPRTSPKAISTGFEDVDYTVGLDSAGRLQRERSDGH